MANQSAAKRARSLCFALLLLAACDSKSAAGSSEDVTVTNDYGALSGTLRIPGGSPPFAAVLIIAGSGATDRNGNAPGLRSDAYAQLAEALARRGIASVRYDKAGIGKSAAAAPAYEELLRFEMPAHDAALWIARMRQDPRFDRITVVGHSEGALLGILAHAEVAADAVVSLAGAGRPLLEVLREQLEASLADAELRAKALNLLARIEKGEIVRDVPAELFGLCRPSVQPYLHSWMQYDPADELSQVRVPVLILQGTTDLQVSLEDARALSAASPGAVLTEIEGMNHVLKLDDGSRDEQLKHSYVDRSWRLAPELVEALSAFADLAN